MPCAVRSVDPLVGPDAANSASAAPCLPPPIFAPGPPQATSTSAPPQRHILIVRFMSSFPFQVAVPFSRKPPGLWLFGGRHAHFDRRFLTPRLSSPIFNRGGKKWKMTD